MWTEDRWLPGDGAERARKFGDGDSMIQILIVVRGPQLNVFVKICSTVPPKRGNFTAHKLYFNKPDCDRGGRGIVSPTTDSAETLSVWFTIRSPHTAE